ncbi:hypothetical protein [[Lactobacillus] timonensis]|uniref:hypothetical protein n=1 Tax=[Lactobacillus] timonensis TaxID=1970790 RepID=UPI000C815783|nr:hypothetical protein [[Lactobacillus] timonensis]
MNKLAAQWRAINWPLIIPNVIVQMICWSYVPLAYAVGISTTSFKIHLAPLFIYELLAAFTIVIMYEHHLRSALNLPVLLATVIFAFSGLWNGNVLLVALLVLFPLTMLLIQTGMLDRPAETGLIAYSLTFCFSIPIALVRLTTGFVAASYIQDLLPLFAIVLFYQTVPFVSHNNHRMLDQVITGIFAIACLCLRSLKLPVIVAVIIIVVSWFIMQQRDDLDKQMALVSFTEMLVIILTYWS